MEINLVFELFYLTSQKSTDLCKNSGSKLK